MRKITPAEIIARSEVPPNPTPPHYRFTYRGIKIDPYRLLLIYQITHPAHQHAIKKLLRAGQSHKDLAQDVKEVIQALQRWVEMMEEDKC